MAGKGATRKRRARTWLLPLLIVSFILHTLWSNLGIAVSRYVIASARLPEAFQGFKIAQISDLHNASFGEDNKRLIARIRQETPDIIAITGDLIDSHHPDPDVALRFLKQAARIAPCYLVTGNHEAWLGSAFLPLEAQIRDLGVTLLRDEAIRIEKDGASIRMIGLDDPDFSLRGPANQRDQLKSALSALTDGDSFDLLLSHRPEYADVYADEGIALTLSGHSHGGQIRIPLIGGLIAPGQGFFPKYDAGRFLVGNTTLIVSRGIGNSVIPLRINNPPEVVIVTLMR